MKFFSLPSIGLALWVLFATPLLLRAVEYPPSVTPSGQLRFIENKKQWDEKILYNAKVWGGDLFLEKNALTYYLFNPEDLKKVHHQHDTSSFILHAHAFKEVFVNANENVQTTAVSPSLYFFNYFLGNDPSRWATEVKDYAQVSYDELYKGIDMNVYAYGPNLKYDLIVEPNADAGQVQIQYVGADKLSLQNGNLIIATSIGSFTEQKPYAYQVIDGMKSEVSCKFQLKGNNVTFSIDKNYNRLLPLIIDPTLIFSTYTGSTADNFGFTATYDASGAMYLGGLVHGAGYPVSTGAIQINYGGGQDIFNQQYACDMSITKISGAGNAMIWSTYLGGSHNETPHSLFVDGSGNLLIYGRTFSNNFPTVAGSYDVGSNGSADLVVCKINAAGNALVASTYIGGSSADGVNYNVSEPVQGQLKVNYGDDARGEIIADDNNNVYVATCTESANFPVTASAFQTSFGGGQDGCVFKLSADLSTLLWSSFIGGSDDDACYSLDVFNNEVYASGGTMSSNFPATPGALHSTYLGGESDGFVAHISSDGATLLQSSFIGTPEADQVYFIKLDATSNAYFVGQTHGSYPVTGGVYSNANSGQFIHKLDPALATTIYSTVFGNGNGAPNISPTAFLVDTCENIYVSGWGGAVTVDWPQFTMNMLNMPLTGNALQSTTDGNDFYLAVFKKNMTQLMYATYFGGYGAPGSDLATEHVDGGTSRFDKNGYVYQAVCAGCLGTSLTPTTPGAWSEVNGSFNCNELGFKMEINLFVVTAELSAFPNTTGCVPLTVNFGNNSINATQYFWDFDDGNTSSETTPTHTFTDTGTFHVMLIATDPTACVPIDTAYTTVIVYNTTVNASYTTTLTDYCDSLKVDFAASTSGTVTSFAWDFGDGTTATGQNASHTYTIPGLYTTSLIVSDPLSCNLFDTITQVVDYTHVLIAEVSNANLVGCPPFTANFFNAGYGGITFFWDFGDGQSSTDPSPSHTYPTPGVYHGMMIIADPAACNPFDTAFFTVTVLPYPPVAAFTADPTVIQDYVSEVHFTNQSTGAVYYNWNFGDGTTSNETNPSHTYLLSGDYLACLTANNEGGCPDEACQLIQVRLVPVVDVPNAFSPNGDGQNDVLYVRGQDIKTLGFKVFNRWGEVVFETNNINNGWNGIYKGVQQEMEVYVWTLSATFSDGTASVRSGNVTLLK
ncbi:MAG TPA: PKD domain-containing protein [Chitinophagales bacterium]|nr:PKD domain-containing protein [Chitinophagales bacterium]